MLSPDPDELGELGLMKAEDRVIRSASTLTST
jgi:hypothetical protein